jgi:DNA-binding FrmR family transcriptional regulator
MTSVGTRLATSLAEDALPGRSHDPINNRLRRAASQLTDVPTMHEHGRQPGEVLDQLAAARAALDAVAL